LKSAVERAGILIVAVRPESVKELFGEMPAFGARASGVCVSLAAGIPLKQLRAMSRVPARWVRAMPSPVCRIGRGLTGVCFDPYLTKADRTRVRDLFGRVGAVVEIREKVFDVFTATYSSSHGYHALATLAAAARRAGLDRKDALIASAHALADGILYWRESGLGLDELLREAATPGGIAATTMQSMDEAGYSTVVAKGLKAGIARARRNARR
jgi:pyrroline-5-carboxylate reductase